MKKHHYGQFTFPIINASTHNKPGEWSLDLFKLFLANQRDPLIDFNDRSNVRYAAEGEDLIYKGEGVHLFVDPDTEKVIKNAARNLEDEDIIKYLPSTKVGMIYRVGCKPFLYARLPEATIIEGCELGLLRYEDGLDSVWSVATDNMYQELIECARFAHSMFMMMECFPDSFIEGVPLDQVKHQNWYHKYNCGSVRVARISHSVCPHIRSGHFRVLRSERYTKKRGQVVFVRPTMVKGAAKHSEETCKGKWEQTNDR